MAAPCFNLKSKKEKVSHIIMIYKYANNCRLKYYTGEKVPTKYFSTQKLVSRSYPGYASINQYLKKLKFIAEEIHRNALMDGLNLSPSQFKNKIEVRLGKSENHHLWYEYADKDYQERLKLKGGDKQKVRGEKSRYDLLKRVIKNIPLSRMTEAQINTAKNKLYDMDLSPSYINRVITQLFTLLNKAKKEKLNVCLDFETVNKIRNIKTKDQIFCTLDELEKMYTHKYRSYYLRNAANIFLVGAFTSMRVSEYMEVVRNPEEHIYNTKNKKGDDVTLIRLLSTDKTKKKVAIPMHWIIKDMLSRYKVHPISDVKLNEYIKEVGEAIGMIQDFTRIEYKGRKEIKVTYKRFELLSSHTARRSFVTILYMMGVDLKVIRLFTTHSSEAQLLKYMKMDVEMNAVRMADHDFFKRKPILKVVN